MTFGIAEFLRQCEAVQYGSAVDGLNYETLCLLEEKLLLAAERVGTARHRAHHAKSETENRKPQMGEREKQ